MADAVIGALRVVLGADSAAFEKQMNDLGNKLQSLGTKIAGIGAGLTAGLTLPLVALGKKAFEAFEESDKAIKKLEAALKSTGGTVGVDVILEGALPSGARPDLSVDGTIQLERLDNVIYVGRPAFGQENSTVGLFKLTPDGEALRTNVKLGRSSVDKIEIIEGLQPGDQVILSDMSAQDSFDRIRIAG